MTYNVSNPQKFQATAHPPQDPENLSPLNMVTLDGKFFIVELTSSPNLGSPQVDQNLDHPKLTNIGITQC